jgi:hypothetical protein
MTTIFPMLLGICMTLANEEHDIWIYNAETNADALASSLDLQAICNSDDICSGAPLLCTLITSYWTNSPMCWDRSGDIGCMEVQFIDVPVATIECSNVINCSPFSTRGDPELKFDYIHDPNECCQVII